MFLPTLGPYFQYEYDQLSFYHFMVKFKAAHLKDHHVVMITKYKIPATK